ncbi:LSM10 [Bugula neritina]|uniref:LSM10 n=1 Tax=Bugula neritina TaxID=10212 RepID=A0A7J7IVZ6_BUGNE|nr:LSM10 [Bugula neritina]
MSTIKSVRSAKEKAIACNTLICLLQGLIGQRATIELRNESSVTGLILDVDIYMNVSMSEVSYTGTGSGTVNLEAFYVRGKNIRFVFIPDHLLQEDTFVLIILRGKIDIKLYQKPLVAQHLHSTQLIPRIDSAYSATDYVFGWINWRNSYWQVYCIQDT